MLEIRAFCRSSRFETRVHTDVSNVVLLCNGRTDNKWEVSGRFVGPKSMYYSPPLNHFSTPFLYQCFSTPIPQRVNIFTMTPHISLSEHVSRGNYMGKTLKGGNMSWFNRVTSDKHINSVWKVGRMLSGRSVERMLGGC